MVMANTERISRALGLLRDGLRPKCEDTWRGFYGNGWLETVNGRLHTPESNPSVGDAAFLFKGMKATWQEVFGHGFGPAIRALVFEVADARNSWAHQQSLSTDDTVRALDSMERLLEAFGNLDERRQIRNLRRDLMRQMVEEESRAERRKTAAKPTEGHPTAGLTPWREIIAPHADVAEGNFEQAEFAADLFEVLQGNAEPEYQDPGCCCPTGCHERCWSARCSRLRRPSRLKTALRCTRCGAGWPTSSAAETPMSWFGPTMRRGPTPVPRCEPCSSSAGRRWC